MALPAAAAAPVPGLLLAGKQLTVGNIPIGPVAYASIGTNTADVNGQLWITSIFLPFNMLVTKVGVLQGGTATTDNILVCIYDLNGNFIQGSAAAGVLLSGANTFKELSLVATTTLYGPQQYFVAVQGNGTAAGAIQTIAASTYNNVVSSVVAGTFGSPPATITVPTTFTAGQAPVVYFT